MAASSSKIRIAAVAASAAGVSYAVYHNRNSANTRTFPKPQPNATPGTSQSTPSDSQSSNNVTKMQWSGFTELKLAKSEQVSPNVKKLTFSLPDDNTVTGLEPVSSLITQHTPDGGWLPIFRPYTPMSPPNQAGTIEFLIKKYPQGRASGKMHALQPGETMRFRPLPAVEYAYQPNMHADVLLIAGGSGITPIWQLVNVILSNPDDRTKIALVYANNSERDILLRGEIEELERRYPARFRKVFTVSRLDDTAAGAGAVTNGVHQGYVTQDVIRKVWSGQRLDGQKVLVSGPPAMVDSVAGKKGLMGWSQGSVGGVLAGLGYRGGDVHKF